MSEDVLSCAQGLSDPDLVARVKFLAQHEREATVLLVAHLAVMDERRLYLGEGYSSLFTYCTEVLHLAEHAAYNRIEAARAARKFPAILTMLGDGSLTLATVRLLGPHLTLGNHSDLFTAARHMSKRQVEEFVAHLHPKPSVPSCIRMLPVPRHAASSAAVPESMRLRPASDAQALNTTGLALTDAICALTTRPAVVEPLGTRRFRVQFTATAETRDKLRLAQDLLRHQIPDGDLGQIMDRALTLLIETLARQKFAATVRPRDQKGTGDGRSGTNLGTASGSGSRHIPAEVRRNVWLRDGGRCAFVANNGRRCDERGFLEFHHVVPHAAGGDASVENIQLRCRAHNGYEAARYFGNGAATLVPDGLMGSAQVSPAGHEQPRRHAEPG